MLKLAVAKKIRDFVFGGGYMFAMCNATDTFDIALAADGVDIVEAPYDGDGADPNAESKLKYDNCFAFKDFRLITNPYEMEFSSIDNQQEERGVTENNDWENYILYMLDMVEVTAKNGLNRLIKIRSAMEKSP